MRPSQTKSRMWIPIFILKNQKEKENKKIRKNGAACNTDEQCFGQLHGMAMACGAGAALKTLMGFNVSLCNLEQKRNSRFRVYSRFRVQNSNSAASLQQYPPLRGHMSGFLSSKGFPANMQVDFVAS